MNASQFKSENQQNPTFVRNMFILGMANFIRVEVLNIQPMNKMGTQTQAEIFEQYVEIVKTLLGGKPK